MTLNTSKLECVGVKCFKSWVKSTTSSFSPLGRSGPARTEVGVGFRFVGLVQALPSHPPLRWSCSVSVGLRFSLLLPFQGWLAPGQVCWCWCLLFPSSFAFPSSGPGYVILHPPFHPHLHLICMDTTLPKAGCVCVCSGTHVLQHAMKLWT